jgi:hypothetical protein
MPIPTLEKLAEAKISVIVEQMPLPAMAQEFESVCTNRHSDVFAHHKWRRLMKVV